MLAGGALSFEQTEDLAIKNAALLKQLVELAGSNISRRFQGSKAFYHVFLAFKQTSLSAVELIQFLKHAVSEAQYRRLIIDLASIPVHPRI